MSPARYSRFMRFPLTCGLAFVPMAMLACGTDPPRDALESNGPDAGFGGSGRDGSVNVACTVTTVAAVVTRRPVDVVLIADTSASMGAAVAAVQQNINASFAQILLQSGIDFRVIALADTSQICVAPPLGGAACGQPAARFFPVNLPTGSGNGLSAPIAGYASWSPHLRANAYKVILQLSDTTSISTMSAAEFDAALTGQSPPQFGTPGARAYTYHGILGVPPKSPVTDPWLPSDPVLSGGCDANGLAGQAQPAYQEVAILSGGLRYPLCEPSHYDVVFKKIADGVIASAAVPCSLAKPTPATEKLDETTLVVRYTSSAGAVQRFEQVANAAACKPAAFYLSPTTVELCPQACTTVQADTSAKLDVEYGCPPAIR